MPLIQWTRYRQTRNQKRKALQMLALSGVVRPSTHELRYPTLLFHHSIEPSATEQTGASKNLPNKTIPSVTTDRRQTNHLGQQLHSMAFALLAESKRCLQKLQRDNRTAA